MVGLLEHDSRHLPAEVRVHDCSDRITEDGPWRASSASLSLGERVLNAKSRTVFSIEYRTG